MIPTKPSDAERESYVVNVIAAFRAAPPAAHERGRNWYPAAHDIARIVGDGDPRIGAGVIAALSPNKSWDQNVRLATDAGKRNIHGHVGDALGKVRRILNGADPETVLPPDSKTWNFFRCIFDPTDPDPIVVDRHAHDIAVNKIYGNRDRGLSAAARYAVFAHTYRVAAVELDIIPQVLQATVWCAHIDRQNTK